MFFSVKIVVEREFLNLILAGMSVPLSEIS